MNMITNLQFPFEPKCFLPAV